MVSVRDTERLHGWQAVVLENERIRVVVLPEKGCDIYSLVARQHDIDLLWKAPWGLRPPGFTSALAHGTEAAWMDQYEGGWQVIFPNGGTACTYAGAPLGFHGEASVSPWTYAMSTGVDGSPELSFELRCVRSPFRLRRRMALEADRPVLRIWEEVTNEGANALPYMWGHHPAYGSPFLDEGCLLDIPAASYEADADQGPGSSWLAPGVRSAWPQVARPEGGTVDLRCIPGPDAHVANLGYPLDLAEGWYALRNPARHLGIGLVWPREVFPYLWLWQEFCGSPGYPWYGSAYVMGVEPHSSYPGRGLAQAIARGTARWLEPGGLAAMELRAVLFDGASAVQRIAPDGTITLAS